MLVVPACLQANPRLDELDGSGPATGEPGASTSTGTGTSTSTADPTTGTGDPVTGGSDTGADSSGGESTGPEVFDVQHFRPENCHLPLWCYQPGDVWTGVDGWVAGAECFDAPVPPP